MPLCIEKLPDQPIVIVVPEGVITCEQAIEYTREAMAKLFSTETDLANHWKYLILDIRKMSMELNDIVCLLDYHYSGLPGTFSDGHTFGAIIGTSLRLRAFQRLGFQRGGLDTSVLRVCLRMEDALAAVQEHIAAH